MKKICQVTFNRDFHYDDVIKMKNNMQWTCRQLRQLQDINIEKRINQYLQRYNQFSINMLSIFMENWLYLCKFWRQTSKFANSYFEFQGQYDDDTIYLMAKWDMKSHLRLILYPNMKRKIEGSRPSRRAIGVLYRHFVAHICYVLQELARTHIHLERTLIPLLMVIKR